VRRAAAVIALIALASPAFAGARDELARAERHWRELDYDLCVEAGDAALAAADATPANRVEALRLKGSALVVLGREADAVAAFDALFELDPDYQMPEGTSPRILGVFQPARATWQVKLDEKLAAELGDAWSRLQLEVRLPARARGGLPLAIPIRLTDPAHLADSLVLAYRRRGERHYSTLSAAADRPQLTITLPGATTASPTDYALELFVRARHRSGSTLRWQGDPDRPLHIPVAAGAVPHERPLVQRWYVVAGGALVIGVLGVIAIRSRDVGPQPIVGKGP